jgi:PAS domain S-box-containing protein
LRLYASETERSLLRAVVEATVDGILTIDDQGTILSANSAIYQDFGFSSGELIGENIRSLLASPYREDLDLSLADQHHSGNGHASGIHREAEGVKKDGTVFSLDISLSETRLEHGRILTAVLRDITERKKAAEQILRERALLNAVVNTAVDAIITIDEIGTIRSANRSVEGMFGYTPEELIGKNVRMLMPSPYQESHDSYLRSYQETGVRKIIGIGRQAEGLRKDGSVFPIDLAVSETPTEDGLIFTGIIRDISDRIRTLELQIAKEASDKANAAKSEFLSRMSHELRTPLNAVLGFAQVLDLRYEDARIQEVSQSIIKAGEHLLNLINEVLDLSRIEAGQLSMSLEPAPVVSIIEQAIELVRPLAEQRGVHCEMQAVDCRDVLVTCDRQRLLQVFINLLSNAIKYNRTEGRVEIRCEPATPPLLSVSFTDTGIGIGKEFIEKLFQPFERFSDPAVEGTGLGLVLSKRFVELMGGTLQLDRSGPDGSRFVVLLETIGPGDGRYPIALPASFGSSDARLRAGSVLYIEDNLSNLKLIEMVLESFPDIELIPALQGQVGLDLARTHLPDVILLDVHLPDMFGPEVLQRLKSDPLTSKIPVIVISADATPGQIKRLEQAGAKAYLTKPLDIKNLLRILESVFSQDENPG